ncbi:choline-sulfatase [Labrys wisconsinensis]|uniref:Choline-sulfatase n=1 Tax=Labrys wisconsinensis TaxID=425677 RepID=A0ABU0J3A2_9HYPH|nr:choline-sulfatase [Labrys wisconsinensis]MDQ0468746.1 choline-sulfatase [Labrys wisconsinensis]
MSSRPNILLVMADQLAPACLPIHGHGIVKAPNLERLGRDGVVFDSAYCNSPLCSPSRAVFMTGRLPSRTGVYDNAAEFRSDIPTWAHYLRRAGYRTTLSGKMHFCGPDQLHGFEERLTTDIYPADYGWTPDWDRPQERPSWYHNMSSVTEAGPCVRTNQLDFDDEVIFAAERALYDHVRSSDRRPFCLVASLTHPHDPFAIPREYWDLYRDEDIVLPRVEVPLDRLDPHSRRLRHVCDMDATPIDEKQVRAARRAYFGAISYVDAQVGRLLRALEATGLRDDTIVIFTSDHGEMLGERGLWYKMSWFEGSARVPLLVSAPGRYRPGRVGASVSLVDLLPTLVEMAGGDPADLAGGPSDGRSLVPHCEGRGGHDEVIGEYLAEGAVAPLMMIRRGPWKFVHSPADPDQLYDLEADPDEVHNLAEAADHAATLAEFRAEAARRWDMPALDAAVRESQRRRRLVDAALTTGTLRSWDFQPFVDASRQYMRNSIDLDDLEARARFPKVKP